MRNLLLHILSKMHTKLLVLRNKNISLGRNTVVHYKSHIVSKSKEKIIIGENCQIGRSARNYHAGMPFYTEILNDGEKSEITIGDNCRINGAYIHAQKRIVIGNNCVMASGISIIDSNGHELYSSNRTHGRDHASDIEIGNNVWIGLNATILKNTSIGDNSVVSAGSVVSGRFPNNSLIVGNPGKVVKYLNIDENERH